MSRRLGGLRPLALLAAARGERGAPSQAAIVVAGAPSLVPLLAGELRAGGASLAVREGFDPRAKDVAALVWIGPPDENVLREAARVRVPIVAVTDAEHVPYVLATDIVRVPAGQGLPVGAVARALAGKLGDAGPSLAAALPVLREPVVDALIRSTARTNAALAAGAGAPAAPAMPVLTLNQVRLVTKIAAAHGQVIDRSRALQVLGVVGAGFGLRAVGRAAHQLPRQGAWALRASVAFAGTTAVGEAARRLFASPA